MEILAWFALQTDTATWPDHTATVAKLANSVADRAPQHAKRVLLNGAISLPRLNEPHLARQLLDRIDVAALTKAEADTFAALTKDPSDAGLA